MKKELLGMLYENHDVRYSYEYFYGNCIMVDFTVDTKYNIVISKQGNLFKADISYLTDVGYMFSLSVNSDNVKDIANEIISYIEVHV